MRRSVGTRLQCPPFTHSHRHQSTCRPIISAMIERFQGFFLSVASEPMPEGLRLPFRLAPHPAFGHPLPVGEGFGVRGQQVKKLGRS